MIWMIANTSKHGLGNNLCQEIINIGYNNLLIISCNKKSFNRDYDTLKNKYIINKLFSIKTNYEVCYLVEKNNINMMVYEISRRGKK